MYDEQDSSCVLMRIVTSLFKKYWHTEGEITVYVILLLTNWFTTYSPL